MFAGIFLYIQICTEARKPEHEREKSMHKCQICSALFALIKLFSIIYYSMVQDQVYYGLILAISPYFIQDYLLSIITKDLIILKQINEDLQSLDQTKQEKDLSHYSKIPASLIKGQKLIVKLNQRETYFKKRKMEVQKVLRTKIGTIQFLSFLGTLINSVNMVAQLLQDLEIYRIVIIVAQFLGILVYITVYSEVRKPQRFQVSIKNNSFQTSILFFVSLKIAATAYYCVTISAFSFELSFAIYPYLIQNCFIYQVKRQGYILSAIEQDIEQLRQNKGERRSTSVQAKITRMQIQKKKITRKASMKQKKENYFKQRKNQIQKGLNVKIAILQALAFLGSISNSAIIILFIQKDIEPIQIGIIAIHFLGILVYISLYAKARNPIQIQNKTLNSQLTCILSFSIINIGFVGVYCYMIQSIEYSIIFTMYPYFICSCILFQNKRDFHVMNGLLRDKNKFKKKKSADVDLEQQSVSQQFDGIGPKEKFDLKILQATKNWKKNYFEEEKRALEVGFRNKVASIQCISFSGAVINIGIIIYLILDEWQLPNIIVAFFHLIGIFLYISIYASAIRPIQLQRTSGKIMLQYSMIFIFLNFLLLVLFKIVKDEFIFVLLISPGPYMIQDWLYCLVLNDIDSIDQIDFDLNKLKNQKDDQEMLGQNTTLSIQKQKLANKLRKKAIRKEIKSQIFYIQCLTFIGAIYNSSVVVKLIVENWDIATISATLTNLIGIFVYITVYTEARKTEPVVKKTIQSTTYQLLCFAFLYLAALTFYGISKGEFNIIINISFFPFLVIDCLLVQIKGNFTGLQKVIDHDKRIKKQENLPERMPLNSGERLFQDSQFIDQAL